MKNEGFSGIIQDNFLMEKRSDLQGAKEAHKMDRLRLLGLVLIIQITQLACNISLIPSKIQQIPTVLPGSGCALVDVFGKAKVDNSCQKKQDEVREWLTNWGDPIPTSLPGPTATPNCNPLPVQTAVIGGRYIVSPDQSQKAQRAQETLYPGRCIRGKFAGTATPFAERTPTLYNTKGFVTPTRNR